MRAVFLFTAVLAVSGCSASLDEQVTDLIEAKNRWLSNVGDPDYSFVYQRRCFCRYDGKEIAIVVKNGRIVQADFVTKGINDEQIDIASLQTMRQLFELVFESLKEQEREGHVSVEAVYDAKLGYPKRIGIDRKRMDGDAVILVSNVSVL